MALLMGMLANRLGKNLRHLRKWARREGITCFRVYDGDIPEHPLTVDLYEGNAVAWAAMRRRDETPQARQEWLAQVRLEMLEGLGLRPEQLFLKDRRPGGQYRKAAEERAEITVQEAGLEFLVNLSDYHDTGLFLDHRQTRALVGSLARGRRFLNLFCYTGSFTVHAGAGGALETTSVDLSAPYLDWTERNLRLNGLTGSAHRLVQADILSWLPRAAREGLCYDLVVCDPPTFSNSKRMDETLDLGRDHPLLLARVLDLLARGGELFFSTNHRRFELDWTPPRGVHLEEITDQTIPVDYSGHRPHRCWHLLKD
jgi:23S rRNA G2069 N7-methylase RlmK/C1962 C5-methylase RlmI